MNETGWVENTLKRRLAAGEPSIVLALRMARTIDVVGMVAASGHDAFYVDMQHNSMSVDDVSALCTAGIYAGITPLVRVPGADEGLCARLLDGGAMGIIVPDVTSAAQAQAVSSWCRFPPFGVRSAGSPLALARHRSLSAAELAPIANAETLVFAMLESQAGLDAAEAIAAVDGIDALFVGSNDLTAALGVPGEFAHPRMREAFAHAIAAASRHAKHLLVGGIADLEIFKTYVAMGAAPCQFAGTDSGLLAAAAAARVAAFRATF